MNKANSATVLIAYFQTIAFSDALYLAFPFKQINWTPEVFSGVGILTSIFWPSSDGLKLLFRTTFTSILVRPTSRTKGMTLNGNDMSFVVRYLEDFESFWKLYKEISLKNLNFSEMLHPIDHWTLKKNYCYCFTFITK